MRECMTAIIKTSIDVSILLCWPLVDYWNFKNTQTHQNIQLLNKDDDQGQYHKTHKKTKIPIGVKKLTMHANIYIYEFV